MDRVYIGDIKFNNDEYKNTTLFYNKGKHNWRFELRDDKHMIVIFNSIRPGSKDIILYDYHRAILASHGTDF